VTPRTFLGLVVAAAVIAAVCYGTLWLAASDPDDHRPPDPTVSWIAPATPTNP
jgi:hypothetical protein